MKPLTRSTALAFFVVMVATAEAGPMTYDFSGVVTGTSGVYSSVPIGSSVTGTYTFDLANASPSQSSGVVGSSSFFSSWTAQIFGGSYYLAAPTPIDQVVFSSTASVDGFDYASFPPSPHATFSRIIGMGPPFGSYEADESVCTAGSICGVPGSTFHSSSLFGGSGFLGFTAPYTSDGLPDFSAGDWHGDFATGWLDTLDYSINSLTPAPVDEPSSLALLGLGIVGIWWARRLRQRALPHKA